MSNAPWANTGYGSQTRTFAPRLKALGHEVIITAFYGLEGGILNWDGIPVYPKGRHPVANDVAAAHTRHAGGNVLITLYDAWVYEPDMLQLHGVRWIPWFPVDMEPMPPPIERKVRKAYRRLVYSRFGERMVNDAGMDCTYVPHGIDTAVFKPLDRDEMRQRLNFPDTFIVGMVAANKGWPSRKAFPEAIEAFARFNRKHPDSILYLHTVRGEFGEAETVNLPELCQMHGLEVGKNVHFPDQYQLLIGYPDEYMNGLYNSFDVLLSPSLGEGFGLPIVEAQAAGCPVIVGDWTAMSELCLSGWKIPKECATPLYTLGAAYQFIPHVGAIVDALEQAYRSTQTTRDTAAKRARIYDADRVTEKYWKPALQEIEEAIGEWQA